MNVTPWALLACGISLCAHIHVRTLSVRPRIRTPTAHVYTNAMMPQQLAHSSQQFIILLLLLLPRKTASSPSLSLHDSGRRRVHLAEASVMIYTLFVCCLLCFMLPCRCHSLKLSQYTRAPKVSTTATAVIDETQGHLRVADVFTSPIWQRRVNAHPTYAWLSRRPLWNHLEVQNCCESLLHFRCGHY